MNTNDEIFIRKCFELASLGEENVFPNPLVGAVIVKDGKIISEGFHKEYGKDHAEADAIKNSKEDLTGATLYCNLEPCCHTNKQTPPCVPLIIQKRISKVVISNVDPNPSVAGKGAAQLREAGIEVIAGILAEEGKVLNKKYFEKFTA
jgi:diaminohydroxyphosphoribosylaminopyrimidine deaminase / 5-amino-6-(5-phosphoribosylamino)uracil reductase